MEKFSLTCNACGSERVGIAGQEEYYNAYIEIHVYCTKCSNEEEYYAEEGRE